jgi:hypothetical protein
MDKQFVAPSDDEVEDLNDALQVDLEKVIAAYPKLDAVFIADTLVHLAARELATIPDEQRRLDCAGHLAKWLNFMATALGVRDYGEESK